MNSEQEESSLNLGDENEQHSGMDALGLNEVDRAMTLFELS